MEKAKLAWKRLLNSKIWRPHPLAVAALAVLAALGLTWVFSGGYERSLAAYVLYPFSAYALTILVILLGKAVPKLKRRVEALPAVRKLRAVKGESAFGIGIYAEQFLNFFYGAFKIGSGIAAGSAWLGADGIYNFAQALIQLYQIHQHRRAKTLPQQWKGYIRCGYMLLALQLTMTGMVFQMIHMGRHKDYTEIMIIATATFTFYKLIKAIVLAVKDRKHKNPMDSAARYLKLSQGLYNLFVLQVGMLWVFGGGSQAYGKRMNSLTGGAVCLLICGMGIYMIRRGRRDLGKTKSTA